MASDLKKINIKNIEARREFRDSLKHIARCVLWLPEALSLRGAKKGIP